MKENKNKTLGSTKKKMFLFPRRKIKNVNFIIALP